jgi:transketolase
MDKSQEQQLKLLSQRIRFSILTSTTEAGSGHLTSSLSAVELMTTLLFGGFFRYDIQNPENPANDRLIFSKGHASPLLYSLWTAAGKISEKELLTLRKLGSKLEGHPVPKLPYVEAATGSLGQGLSIGLGMALAIKMGSGRDRNSYNLPKVYVLLGDSEMSEGSNWEAIQLAAYYKVDNVIGIIDVNRLGQRGETLYGYDLKAYEKRIAAFGWETIVVRDGNHIGQIAKAYKLATTIKNKPVMIIAKTIKGKGVSFLEDREGWHGKALSQEELKEALRELGNIDKNIRGTIAKPEKFQIPNSKFQIPNKPQIQNRKAQPYKKSEMVATRKAYGNALVRIFPKFPEMVVLDAEVSNSTYSEIFKKEYPARFLEMFIAEQNMVGVAVGLARRGKLPFVSTFAAFFTRAYDQIRMAQYSDVHIVFAGSHAGVSIGQDGPSQMGLEDIAMFRAILGSIVLYPADAVSCEKLVEEAAKQKGIVYIRTTRSDTPVIYDTAEEFPIGGSKILRQTSKDDITIIAAGITLHEALKAHDILKNEGIFARVIDLYSIKPIDGESLKKAASETKAIVTVEDHFAEGGLGEAVKSALSGTGATIYSLSVRKIPTSGKPEELLDYEEISAKAIVRKVKKVLKEKWFI